MKLHKIIKEDKKTHIGFVYMITLVKMIYYINLNLRVNII